MKKPWLIPLFVLLILITAGIFRWDEGPTQSFKGSLRIQYYKDRITSQTWLKLYGSIPEEDSGGYFDPFNTIEGNYWDVIWSNNDEPWQKVLHGVNVNPNKPSGFTGVMYPYFTNEQIKVKSKEIISGPKGTNKKRSLQKALQEAQHEKASYNEYHLQYLAVYKSLRSDRSLLKESGALAQLALKDNLQMNVPDYVVIPHIPQDIASNNDLWKKADRHVNSIENQISQIEYWSMREAKKELTQKSELTRNLATIIWVALLAISLIMTLLLFFRPMLFNSNKAENREL